MLLLYPELGKRLILFRVLLDTVGLIPHSG